MFADFGVVNFWTYLLGATLIVLVPGPETMFVIKTSITSGIKRGFAAIFSILLSDVILVLLAWCGLAAVISSTPALFNAIKYAGAAYLFYLGVQTIRAIFKPAVETSEEKKSSADTGGIIGRGMLVTLLNPKTLLFYISFFAQFINVQAEHSWMAFIILAAVMFAITLVYFGFLVFCGSFLLSRLKGNRRLSAIGNALVGMFFIGFAARLASATS
ncbi:leucine efflux protein LeuE [Salmonella enterica subsp. enterica serovar Poona]|nr:leucine efflux protein LeuE [Salmonella enterica]EEP8161620.1 leucine efflux protein LeuE [Salmonella enterica subsp. enterica serovar Poona]HAE7712442.1 leucine efflux protein LeuE [Salmonella enterica subsp. enterica]EBE9927045.1 leucine efflux protein LeuE [Salmonella enterica]EIU8084702.1 leucine efflux protein LeuE [Salmonella enterica subsp. enterica serovar Poona]